MLITLPLMLTAPAALVSQNPQPPNLEQVLAKHFEAMGGLKKLTSIKSTRITGKMRSAQIVIVTKQPYFIRYELNDELKVVLSTI